MITLLPVLISGFSGGATKGTNRIFEASVQFISL